MKILSAKFANAEGTAVVLQTEESGAVALDLAVEEDNSNGWRDVYFAWGSAELGNAPEAYVAPVKVVTPEEHLESEGFNAVRLLSLKDIQDRLAAAGVAMPPKAAAVRAWVSGVQFGEPPFAPAPHSFADVKEELRPLVA